MRMWMVNPKFMCDKHLLGEHLECHMLLGSLEKGKSLDGYIQKGLIELHNLKSRHDELAQEMWDRGMNHKTPMPDYVKKIAAKLGKVDKEKNLEELLKRCSRCWAMHLAETGTFEETPNGVILKAGPCTSRIKR